MYFSEWYDNVSRVQLERIAEIASTKVSYLRLLKGGWASPSLDMKLRLLDASKMICPELNLEFSGESITRGRNPALHDHQIKKIIVLYKTTDKTIPVICKEFGISTHTFDRYLRYYDVKRDRAKKDVVYG